MESSVNIYEGVSAINIIKLRETELKPFCILFSCFTIVVLVVEVEHGPDKHGDTLILEVHRLRH